MAGNQFGGGGEKFQAANSKLQRQVVQMGTVSPQLMLGSRIDGTQGNVAVAQALQPQVSQAVIGKGDQGVRGAPPIRVMGGGDAFGHQAAQVAQPQGQFHPAPQPQSYPQPQAAPSPQPQHAQLGANQEIHVLVATLRGPSGQKYEAIYEVVAQERGSKVLGVSERPMY